MGALRDFVARDPRTDAPAVVNFPMRDDNPYLVDVPATRGADRPLPARAHHLRAQHGAAPRAGRRDQTVPHRAGHRRRRPLRHGARARPRRAALPGAVRRGRRPGHRLDPQDLLRHAARGGRRPLSSKATSATTSGRRCAGGPSRARSPTTTWARSWACCSRPTRCAPSATPTSPRSSPTPRPSPGRWPTPGSTCRATRRSTSPRPTRSSCGSGYGRGHEMAARLEASNVLCNYQGLPDEEAFTAAGGLRLGVAEMTRFGMRQDDFGELAGLMADVIAARRRRGDSGERPARALRRAAVLLWRRASWAASSTSSPRCCDETAAPTTRGRAARAAPAGPAEGGV